MNPETAEFPHLLHRWFADTPYGEELAEKVRWDRYRPEGTSEAEWVGLLGADVNNLEHLRLTHGLTRVMIEQSRILQRGLLTSEDELLLETAAYIHDWGESVMGDITYSHKTEEHEKEEAFHLRGIVATLPVDDDQHRLVREALEKVVLDPSSRLGHVFNTVERVGYVRTALRASSHVAGNTNAACENGFKWMIADSFGGHIPELIARSQMYLPVAEYLHNQAPYISQAFEWITDEVFNNYPPEERGRRIEQFYGAWEVWTESVFYEPSTSVYDIKRR